MRPAFEGFTWRERYTRRKRMDLPEIQEGKLALYDRAGLADPPAMYRWVTLPHAGCAEQSACIRNALGRHCGEAGVPGGPREGSSEDDRLRSDPLNLAGRARLRESAISASPVVSSLRPKTVIIGAGVMGLGIAWRLAQAGCRVTVYDRAEAGHGASWAAAGMLAAAVETEPGEEKLLALTLESQRMWPAFASELETATGTSLGYRDEGTIVVALTRDDAEQLRFTYDFQKSLGLEIEWLSGAEARRREPHLRPGIPGAVLSPRDHQVDNRRLACALAQAARGVGAVLREHDPVREVEVSGGRACAVVTDHGRDPADVVVLAAGAWSREIGGISPTDLPPVRPIKGQMLALQMDPAAPLLRHVVWLPRGYLVPRQDGRLIVGATVEERGFDDALTAGGLFALIESAWRAMPAIEELPLAEMWVGFRPGSRDDAPMLGPSGVDRLVVATGHHRNGILLTPLTAHAVSGYVLTGRLSDAVAPFTPERFRKGQTQSTIGTDCTIAAGAR
jgi:glycine oxidase